MRHDTGSECRRALRTDDLGPKQPVAVSAVAVIARTTDGDGDGAVSGAALEPATVAVERVSTGQLRECARDR